MTRWERDIYINLLAKHLKEEKEKMALKAAEQRSQMKPISPIRKR